MFDPKNHIHWVAAILIALLLILVFAVSSGGGQDRTAPEPVAGVPHHEAIER